MKIPKHTHVFVVSPKITVHCTMTRDSDDETEDWPIVMIREVIYGFSTLRFVNFNYTYANLSPYELTDQEEMQEYSCPQAQVLLAGVAGIFRLLQRREGRQVKNEVGGLYITLDICWCNQ